MEVLEIKENKTSLPMLYWSGQPSKEVTYDDSIFREQRFCVFLSASGAFGHQSHFPGPLFSALRAVGPQGAGGRRWTLEYVLYVSLLMVLDGASTLGDRFAHARQATVAMFGGRRRPGRTYQGYVQARRRIHARQRRMIQRQVNRFHRQIAGTFWRCQGWQAFAADGTRIELPRTVRNERAFGCAGRKKTAPQLFLTSLYHLGTGLPWAWRIGPGTDSEREHLRRMIGTLPAGSLLVMDAGFSSFDLLRSLRDHGVEVLVRLGSNRTLLTALEDTQVRVKGPRAWLWPQDKQTKYPPLQLRLLRIEQANHTPLCLATSVLDEQTLTDQQIGQFYRMRWGQELFHRSFKRTLQQHKLHSTSPREVRRELDWALLAYLVLGLWTVEAQIQAGRNPLTWSVSQSLRIVRAALGPADWRRRRRGMTKALQAAVQDRYVRRGSKSARNWPHKKKDHPPGLPKLREATAAEKRRVQKTYANTTGT